MLLKPYDTMTEALDDLYKMGFTYDFNLVTKKAYDLDKNLPIRDFVIIQILRFENYSDPAENAILFAISSEAHKLQGTLVNGFGIYADPLTNNFINSICCQEDIVIRH